MVDAEGWQQARAQAAPPRVRVETPLETTNPYGVLESLPDKTVLEEDHQDVRAKLSPPPKRKEPKSVARKSTTTEGPPASGPGPSERRKAPTASQPPASPPCVDSTIEAEKKPIEFEAQQIFDRPHQASYFIPGRVEGRPAQFLLDTGCTTNLLA